MPRAGRRPGSVPPVTVCVLVYGDHADLARRVLSSVQRRVGRSMHRLVVGANAVGDETLVLLWRLHRQGVVDRLLVSSENLNKCRMMRRMFAGIDTEYIWWFDDDSYVTDSGAADRWLDCIRAAGPAVVLWGQVAQCDLPTFFTDCPDVLSFVRTASWYRGLPPPSWRPGGKGEFDYHGWGTGDGRWLFVLGGCWMIRTSALRSLDWPDPRLIKLGDDVLLGEAVRQQGWRMEAIPVPGVAINTAPRRGDPGPMHRSSNTILPSHLAYAHHVDPIPVSA